MMSSKDGIAGFIFIIGVLFLIWSAQLWFGFSIEVNKGKRLTDPHYRKTRLQIGLLTFLTTFFLVLGGLLGYGDIKVENLSLILVTLICLPLVFAGMTLFGFSAIPWRRQFLLDEEEEV